MIPYYKLKVDMEVEALSLRRAGKRWLPARIASKYRALQLVSVRILAPSGDTWRIYRRPSQLRLKPKGGGG